MENGSENLYHQIWRFQEIELEILSQQKNEKLAVKYGAKYFRAIDRRKERFSLEKPLVLSSINSSISSGEFQEAANNLFDFVQRLSLGNFLIEQLQG